MPLQLSSAKKGIVWNGSFFVHHSLALVNRELMLALLQNETFTAQFDLSIAHYEPPVFGGEADGRFAELETRMRRTVDEVSVTVRHKWPPEFTQPSSGKLALIQPWEYGSLPSAWVPAIDRCVDEVWVPSSFVRSTYVESGVAPEKVVVVPNGVNMARFHPGVAPCDFSANPLLQEIGADTYKFLFVGGTIARKGVDVLLDAYDRAFTRKDNVVLIIKDFGANSFYANQGAAKLIRERQQKQHGAQIIYLTDDMTEAEIASLYAACDCLVHPYRGEGYGLPIVEAMACGKPTLVTNFGAALDFANESNAYLIPASVQPHPEKRVGDLPTVGHPYWAEPDREALAALMRQVVSHREEAQARGAKAAGDIQANHTWAHAASIAAERLVALASHAGAPLFNLPMGLSNLSLGGLNLAGTPGLRALGEPYETRKQAALQETRQGDWRNALNDLEACRIERPGDMDILNALAVAYYRTGAVDRAIALLNEGLEIQPQSRDLHHNMAFILMEADRPQQALPHALSALQTTPNDVTVRRTLEMVRDCLLRQARKVLRAAPAQRREAAKRKPEYRALMDGYRIAEQALQMHRTVFVTAQVAANNAEGEKGRRGEGEQSQIENPQHPTPDTRHPRISLCMIAKNEAQFLRGCLESVKDVVDEIVLVDTGSTDGTPAIAREYGAKVVEYAWTDDFAAARNVSLDHATGSWALWLDADEEVAPECAALIREVIATAPAEIGAYMLKVRNWLSSPSRKEGSDMAIHHACRLFRLVPGVRFEGRIHEQNLRSLQEMGYTYVRDSRLIIDHFGYAAEIMAQRNKHDRFIRMLKREVEECPDEGFRQFHLFNLGNAYFTAGDMENAAHYFSQAAVDLDPREEFTITLLVEWATALHRLSRPYEGLEVCEQADLLGIQQAGVEFARGYCLLHMEQYEAAEAAFRQALQYGEEAEGVYAETGDAGVTSYKAHYGLALALLGQDRDLEALQYSEQALEEQPAMVEARYLLSILLTKFDRTAEACRALETILDQSPDHEDAARDLGAILFAGKDYAAALPYIRRTARRAPADYAAQARLATCYESLGLMDEARDVYEQLRLIAPDSPEVCVNLGRILASLGADSDAIDCYNDAIQLEPKYGNAYFNAGDLMYKLGYYNHAAETYMAGLEVEPERESGFFVLGNCYYQLGAFEAAVASYRQALVQEPAHREARHNLELAESLLTQQNAA